MFQYFPEQASDFADKVDWLNKIVTDISVFFTVAIVGTMIYFAIRYRQRNGVDHETPHIEGSHLLEVIWTVVPTLICIVIATFGYIYFDEMRTPPENAMTINVRGQKWFWEFEYENGKKRTGELVVPVNEPIKLLMTSSDVLHSFFIPAMRIKMDVVPGQYTYQWFRAIKTGDYPVFCTEYCGKDHSSMRARLKVLPREEYDRWLNDKSEEEGLARMNRRDIGEQIYNTKGCFSCHSLDGSPRVGPSFLKVFGKKELLEDGSEVTVDEAYLRSSIYEPTKQVVKGFPGNSMPNFTGQISEDEMLSVIAFIKSVDGTQPVQAASAPVAAEDLSKLSPLELGKKLFTLKACVACHSLDGSRIVGPSFKGLYGRDEKLTGGTTVKVDDAYIKNSILKPNDQIVEGYPAGMQSFEGQLTDTEIAGLIEYIKSLK